MEAVEAEGVRAVDDVVVAPAAAPTFFSDGVNGVVVVTCPLLVAIGVAVADVGPRERELPPSGLTGRRLPLLR